MKEEEKQVFEPDDLVYLDKMSSVIKKDNENKAIRRAVTAKVESNPFNLLPKKPGIPRTRFIWGIGTVVLVLTVFILSRYLNLNEDNNSNKKQDNQQELILPETLHNNVPLRLDTSKFVEGSTDSNKPVSKKVKHRRTAIAGEPPKKEQ